MFMRLPSSEPIGRRNLAYTRNLSDTTVRFNPVLSGILRTPDRTLGPVQQFVEPWTGPERTRSKGPVQVQRGLDHEPDHIFTFYPN